MFNHWATGLRSGLLPRIVELQCQKTCPKKDPNLGSWGGNFDFWVREMRS